jgi:phosphatidylinositol 4-kinase type 2
MFTVVDPRPAPSSPVDLPRVVTPSRRSEPRGPSRLSSTAPERMHGYHSSLLAALQEEDSDTDDDAAFGEMEIVTSPVHAASQKGGIGSDSDSPTSPLMQATTKPSTATQDIRMMLASGASAPVEVLRNQVVTSLTLKLKPDWMAKNRGSDFFGGRGTSRRLLLQDTSDMPKIDELNTLQSEDPEEYRNLIMRLQDLQYICIKAAVDVSDEGNIEEREYWLPLDDKQTVADLKTLVTGADALEPDGLKLLDQTAVESTADLSIVHAGRQLNDTSTVMEEGLTHNTVVHLFVKKDANITVKMRGTKDLEVTLTADETAESLRAKLEQLRPVSERGLKASKSQLFYGGQELKDGPLSMYGVADGATLELRPYTPARGVAIPGAKPQRHSWNSAGGWKPLGVSSSSWVSSAGSMGGRTFGSIDENASSSPSSLDESPTQYGSPDLARSFDLARRGLAMGKRPQLASGGTGGAYFLRGSDGETCAVFKPADEEPNAHNNPRGRNVSITGEGLRKGTRVGEGASREVAAYVLDHGGFAGVPATSLANLCEMRRSPSGKDLGGKLGSLQAYVHADAEAEELGPGLFPVREVHKITQLDIRLANTDRNAGNILVQKGEGGKINLVPIDHGYALPHTLEDVCFECEFWPQAKVPYDEETKAYIATIDVEADVQLIREQGIELMPSSERVLRVCTILLQKAAAQGCCPADIAGMMSRPMPNRMSDLEKLTSRAAAAATAAVRAEDGLVVHLPANGGKDTNSAWSDLDGDERMESRFLKEYAELLESYLEGFEPQLEH